MNIEKALEPNANKLVIDDDGNATAKILDAELDVVECSFNNDECVEIDTSKFTYLTLTLENLHSLISLIDEAEDHYLLENENSE